jgi:phage-related baseplate assembly protein
MSSSDAEAKAVSPTACNILVYFMMSGGVIPSTDQITAMTAWFSPKSRRPQGDRVTCAAPSEVTYDITMTYYIDAADEASESTITAAVNAAITSYETWQRVMGRDINPSQLIKMVMAAGAKRVVLTAPVHTVINNGADDSADPVQIAKLGTATITNGGLEND